MNGNCNLTPLTDEQREFAATYAEFPKWALRRHAWAIRILGPDEAFSLAQEALIYAARGYRDELGFAPTTYIAKVIFRKLSQACQRGKDRNIPEPLVRVHNGKEYTPEELVSRDEPQPELESDEIASIRSAMRFLGTREREVVERHFLGGESMGEIGASLGLSRSRVDQVKRDALDRLRRRLRLARDGGVCEVHS